jgi:asparagine synthase (glutamine-hydrolysing)
MTSGIEQAGILEHQRTRAGLAGLRARHPLLDPILIELALGQAPQASFHPELTRPLLREAMAGAIPDSVRLRREKAWFDSLIADCMTGPEAPAIRTLLTGSDARVQQYLAQGACAAALATLTRESGPTRFQAMHLLWKLLGIECWLRAQDGEDTLATLAEHSSPRVAISTRPAPRRPESCPGV